MHQQIRHHALTPERLTELTAMLREQQQFRQDQIQSGVETAVAHDFQAAAEIDALVLRGAWAALREIEAALLRVERGTYGRCAVCGEQIPIERLEVIPQTARCVTCERSR